MPAAPNGGVYAEAMAPQDGLPMVASVGPAGEIAPAASVVGQPVSTGDVEVRTVFAYHYLSCSVSRIQDNAVGSLP